MVREDVIRQIVEREARKDGLDEETVSREAPELHSAAGDHFGSWDTALRYAGVVGPGRYATSRCSPASVLRQLRKMCLNGHSLSSQRIMVRDRALFAAARKHFGSWLQALSAVGLDLGNARRFSKARRPSKQQIVQALRERRQQGLSLVWNVACLENRAFAMRAKGVFGSWRRALAAAGLAPAAYLAAGGRVWNKERVVEAIRLRHQEGKSIIARQNDAALVSAARRYFGSWGEALKEASAGNRQKANEESHDR